VAVVLAMLILVISILLALLVLVYKHSSQHHLVVPYPSPPSMTKTQSRRVEIARSRHTIIVIITLLLALLLAELLAQVWQVPDSTCLQGTRIVAVLIACAVTVLAVPVPAPGTCFELCWLWLRDGVWKSGRKSDDGEEGKLCEVHLVCFGETDDLIVVGE
jgi:hypothetical protein